MTVLRQSNPAQCDACMPGATKPISFFEGPVCSPFLEVRPPVHTQSLNSAMLEKPSFLAWAAPK